MGKSRINTLHLRGVTRQAILTGGVPGVAAEAPGQVRGGKVTNKYIASPLGYAAAILTRGVPGVAAEAPGQVRGGKVTNKYIESPLGYAAAILTRGVPGVVAEAPGQAGGEGGEEEVQGPGGDHVVVDGDEGGDEHHGVTHALEERGGLPDGDGAQAGELAERQLHEHQRHPAEHQHHEVGDEERPWGAHTIGVKD